MGRALLTDLYELTMTAAYYRDGWQGRRAACEAFVRRLPRTRRYLVAAGLEEVLGFLETFHFEPEEVDWLASTPALREALRLEGFRDFLLGLRFTGDVWAVPEGTVVFAGEPLLRIEAPLVEAQVVETFLLSAINHATTVASKAARIVQAAGRAGVAEFGARRTHPDAAVDAARAAFLAGFVGTSDLEAGRRWDIPVFGTAAHMFTMAHATELDAFRSYVATFPSHATLLIDTYDTLQGARNAVAAAGPELLGVRLDSGDFLALSREVRRILDEAGCRQTRIVVSGDMNEHTIAALMAEGAPVDVFGVGTELVTSKDAPALGGVYKLVAIEREGRMEATAKFSEGKVTWPGAKQIFRCADHDELGLQGEKPPEGARPLLVQVMRDGKRTQPAEPLSASRERALHEVAALPAWLKRLKREAPARTWEVRPTQALLALLLELRSQHQNGAASSEGSPA